MTVLSSSSAAQPYDEGMTWSSGSRQSAVVSFIRMRWKVRAMVWAGRWRFRFTILLGFIGAALPRVCRAQINPAQFCDDCASLARFPSRVVGSDGYQQCAKELEQRLSTIGNIEWKKQSFPVMTPVTQSSTIDLGDGRVERVYPFWPAQVRVCSTPPAGISGRLVYAGECRYEQLRPASMRGQIAVVEATAGERWTQAAYVGARAILILGSTETTWADLRAHDLRIPVDFPRFYVPPGKLADELRAGKLSSATLKATVTWQRSTACNYYVLVRPPNQIPAGWSGAAAGGADVQRAARCDIARAGPRARRRAGGQLCGGVGAIARCREAPMESPGGGLLQRRGWRAVPGHAKHAPDAWRSARGLAG